MHPLYCRHNLLPSLQCHCWKVWLQVQYTSRIRGQLHFAVENTYLVSVRRLLWCKGSKNMSSSGRKSLGDEKCLKVKQLNSSMTEEKRGEVFFHTDLKNKFFESFAGDGYFFHYLEKIEESTNRLRCSDPYIFMHFESDKLNHWSLLDNIKTNITPDKYMCVVVAVSGGCQVTNRN